MRGLRSILSCAEHDIGARCERTCAKGSRGCSSSAVGVNAHPAEITTEPGLEKPPHTSRQRRAAVPRWCRTRVRVGEYGGYCTRRTRPPFVFRLTRGAFTLARALESFCVDRLLFLLARR